MRLNVSAFVVIFAGLGAGLAMSWAALADETARGFDCEFKAGTSGSYGNGAFQSKVGAAIKFQIQEIDLGAQSARLLAEKAEASGKLALARAIGATHFLEVATEGFWNITTVYDKDPATGLHPAVHSRHFGLLGQPVFAQYTGTCRATQ